jgi:hypothetical protein
MIGWPRIGPHGIARVRSLVPEEEIMGSPLLEKLKGRVPLIRLSGKGRSTVGHSSVAAAKKKKGTANKACQKQAQVWDLFINVECEQDPSPNCPAVLACGDFLKACDFTGFFNCFEDATAP